MKEFGVQSYITYIMYDYICTNPMLVTHSIPTKVSDVYKQLKPKKIQIKII